MDGKTAYDYLKDMEIDLNRATVQIIWLDKGQIDNFTGDDADEKRKFFMKLSYNEQIRMLRSVLYKPNGDPTPLLEDFLEGFTEELEEAVGDALRDYNGGPDAYRDRAVDVLRDIASVVMSAKSCEELDKELSGMSDKLKATMDNLCKALEAHKHDQS